MFSIGTLFRVLAGGEPVHSSTSEDWEASCFLFL